MLLIKISKWGNGQGIRIPKNVLELLKWQKDDELEMIVEKGNLKIQKVEKEKELSGEEKLKKLNAYRKTNQKDILLADASVANQYLNYLKSKNLDEIALNIKIF